MGKRQIDVGIELNFTACLDGCYSLCCTVLLSQNNISFDCFMKIGCIILLSQILSWHSTNLHPITNLLQSFQLQCLYHCYLSIYLLLEDNYYHYYKNPVEFGPVYALGIQKDIKIVSVQYIPLLKYYYQLKPGKKRFITKTNLIRFQ